MTIVNPIWINATNQKSTGLWFYIEVSEIIYHVFDHAKLFVIATTSCPFHAKNFHATKEKKNVSRFMFESPSLNLYMVKFLKIVTHLSLTVFQNILDTVAIIFSTDVSKSVSTYFCLSRIFLVLIHQIHLIIQSFKNILSV